TATSAAKKRRKTASVSKRPKDVFVEDTAAQSVTLRASAEPSEAVFDNDNTAARLAAAKNRNGATDDNDDGDAGQQQQQQQFVTVDAYPLTLRYLCESMLAGGNLDSE